MYDDGKMDGADRIGVTCAQGVTDCSPPNPQFQYVTGPNTTLFPAALQYTFADRMFQTNQEPGFPAQQFIIVERPLPLRLVIYLRRENRRGPAGADEDTGCTAPA